ncbi:MAG: LacI family transcriptional regulator [Acholeplasmataceae bacterium]|nr:LacI family transcriptional regulator [Acholeplasmataceae bacterium]
MKKSPAITLKDLSVLASCSVNTVSRALRNCDDISIATQEKIKKLANEKGYIPNRVPDFMRSGKTNMIGIVISSITNPYFTIAIDELSRELQKHDYFPMIMVSHDDIMDMKLLMKLLENRVSGIFSFSDIDDDVAEFCYKNHICLIRVGSKPQDERVNAIYADRYLCGKLVADEAIRRKVKRPCYINCNTVLSNIDRRNGFLDTLNKAGYGYDEYNCNFQTRHEEADALKSQIISNKNDFIFCFNDEIAAFVLELLEEYKYSNYVVFGIDGVAHYLPICRRINSVGGDFKEISRRCTEILLDKINEFDDSVVHEVYPVELIMFDR